MLLVLFQRVGDFIFGCKFSFCIMTVFECQQFCVVNLPVFKNKSLVSLANNYLVFQFPPDFYCLG